MSAVRVRLHGGPEDEHEINVAADPSGVPTPRVELAARPPNGAKRSSGQLAPMLIYERRGTRSDGTWEFRYVGAQTRA